MVLENVDIFHLIVGQSGIELDYDTACPQPHRAALRLVSSATRHSLDRLANKYCDRRRSREAMLQILPTTIARQAAAAIQTLYPLREIHVEGLNDDALQEVLAKAAACGAAQEFEVLSLQRGVFAGTCLHALAPMLTDPMGASRLSRLLELELGGCGFVTDDGLEAITRAAPSLARLRLTVNSLLRQPRLTCPALRVATLAICANLTDEAVDHLCTGAPRLEELSLWRCSSLVRPLIRGARLRTLNLCECVQLSNVALHHVRLRCPVITTLLLAGCESLSTGEVSEADLPGPIGGNGLTTLDLSDIASMNDRMLSAAVRASPSLRRLDVSRSMNGVQLPSLGGEHVQTIVATRCEHLIDDAVTNACAASPRLTSIMLSMCAALHTPRAHGPRLRDVNMSGCSLLQDAAVSYLCANAPALLSYCERLARPEIHGECLEQLSLSGCTLLEDEPLEGAVASCPRLTKLSINGCGKLVSARLANPSLQILNCQNVPRAVVDAAADKIRLPALRRVVSEEDTDFEEAD